MYFKYLYNRTKLKDTHSVLPSNAGIKIIEPNLVISLDSKIYSNIYDYHCPSLMSLRYIIIHFIYYFEMRNYFP